jgi:single-strand DNA-binding protein
MINRTILFGNLVADPEVRYTKTGKAIANMRIAYNEASSKDQETLYMSVDVWDKQGETCGKILKKGSGVIVEGRLKADSYTDKEGKKVMKTFIVADRVNFVPKFEKLTSNSESSKASKPESKPVENKSQNDEVESAGAVGDEDDIPF